MVTASKNSSSGSLPLIGWKEWLALPDINIPAIKAKIDTGARTSAIHTFGIEEYTVKGQKMVRFGIHPLRQRQDVEIFCEAPVFDYRRVKNSSGDSETRYIIETTAVLGNEHWSIQVSLTNRERMMFRMLLGRKALEKRFIIDPAQSYLNGRALARAYPGVSKKEGKK